MQSTSSPIHSDAETTPPAHPPTRGRTRLIGLFTLLLILVSIAVLPPLVNVSRFQKRIARNISAALGRPVYFDSLTLVLFPRPGFTLQNFVLNEDPGFGYEPILYADQVQVTLRLSSLFRSHTEFSKIAFSSPSVNLVYINGRWNIESLLLQAAHTQAAPTTQRFTGPARRFPYIEATGARLNLKLDQEKSPVSLTDADFALWLPEPHQWHLRLEAHPMRTDSAPGDTGTLRAEGTLGGADPNAATLTPASLAQVPIDLHGDWRDAQLGGLSRLLLGRDPGLRGAFALAFTLRGTVGRNDISANLKLADARRADFVPDHPLTLEASCTATSANTFRAFPTIACQWPPTSSSNPALVALTARLPDARNIDSASGTLTLPTLPADTFFDWLAIATPHPPAVLAGAGTLSGSLTWGTPSLTPQSASEISPNLSPGINAPALRTSASAGNKSSEIGPNLGPSPNGSRRRNLNASENKASEIGPDFSPGINAPKLNRALAPGTRLPTPPTPTLTGEIRFTGGSLVLDPATNTTLALGDVVLRSTPPTTPPSRKPRNSRAAATTPIQTSFTLQPLSLDLGGGQPATLTGHFDLTGYTLHLTGAALPETLRQAAKAVPQFGDNLAPLLDQLFPTQPNPSAEPSPSATKPDATPASTPETPAKPSPIDLTATRPWGGTQTWTDTSIHH